MRAWPLVPLKEVCQINPRIAKDQIRKAGTRVSFVPMSAVSETEGAIATPEERTYEQVAKGYTSFRNGDVLFAKITPCMENGKAAIADNLTNGIGFGSTEFHVLRPIRGLLSEYVFYFLRREDFRRQAKANFTGTAGQQRVPSSFIKSVRIPLPPINEQRRIVDILNRVNGILRLRRQTQEKARQLIPAIFVKMFGDPESNPRKLPVRQLGELFCNGPQNGLYRPRSDYGRGTRILRIGSFYDGEALDVSKLERLEIDSNTIHKYGLRQGDIVINRVNSPAFLGKSTIVPALREPIVFESNMMRVRLNPEQALPQYVIAALQLSSTRRQLLARAKHAINQSSINQSDVRQIRVIAPPLSLQYPFADRVADIQCIIEEQDRMAAASERLVNSLMHRLFDEET